MVVENSPIIQIVNVVASASLKHGIDIYAACKVLPRSKYDRDKFPGLIFRMKKPKASFLLFSSGNMVSTGAKSEKNVTRAINKIIRMLKKEGIIIRGKPKITIQNIVATGDLRGRIDLPTLYMLSGVRGGNVMYEPEMFPGLIYRMQEPSVVLLIFSSGKTVCTGAKNETDVYQAMDKISQILIKHEVITYV
jgi:transcription initiation factor TFIID TATA-box-binding protein